MNVVDLPEFLSQAGKPLFLAVRRFPSLDGAGLGGVTVNGRTAAIGFGHDRIDDRHWLDEAAQDALDEDAALHAVCLTMKNGAVSIENMTGIGVTPNAPALAFDEPLHAVLGIWKDGDITVMVDLNANPDRMSRVGEIVEAIRRNSDLNARAEIVALTGLTLRLAQPGRAEIAPLDLRAILEDEIAAEP